MKKTLSFISALVLVFSFLASNIAYACSPLPGDPWFTYTLSFDQSSLPQGVRIIEGNFGNFGKYAIRNDSTVPVYIVLASSSSPLLPNQMRTDANLLPSINPTYKLVSGKTYVSAYYRDQRGEGFETKEYGQGGVSPDLIVEVIPGIGTQKAVAFASQKIGDNRPIDITIPAPENFKITVYQNGNPIDIKGTITYLLNPTYNPRAAATSGNCNTSTNQNVTGTGFSRSLTVGNSGDDVVQLQTILESRGFLIMPIGVNKGYFGNLTRIALGKYQMNMGISPAVGYFGPITKARISTSQ